MKLFNWNCFETIIEGTFAHDYTDASIRKEIKDAYDKKYRPAVTPLTHPENYDPFDPPRGWSYDPYYEFWIKTNE